MNQNRALNLVLLIVALAAAVFTEWKTQMPASGWISMLAALFVNLRQALIPMAVVKPADPEPPK